MLQRYSIYEHKSTVNCAHLKKILLRKHYKIYYNTITNRISYYSQYIGKKVCTFKGKEITIDITDINEVQNKNASIVFNVRTALYILTIILKVLNYRYGRNKAIHEGNKLGTEIRYL